MGKHKAQRGGINWRREYRYLRNKWLWFTKPKARRIGKHIAAFITKRPIR